MHKMFYIGVSAIMVSTGLGQLVEDAGTSTTEQGAVKRVVDYVPSANEVLWSDLFDVEYIEENSALIVKQQPDSEIYDLFPIRVVDEEMELSSTGSYEILFEAWVSETDLLQAGNSFQAEGFTYEFDIDASFVVFAAKLTGANGVSRIVSGYKYETVLYYTVPANTQYQYEQIVPLQRHLTEDDAILWASYQYDAFWSVANDQGECFDTWTLCNDNIKARRDLQLDTRGIPWTGIGVGGAVGGPTAAGIGATVGSVTGSGAGVIALIGGGFGTIFGAITGGVVEHSDRTNNIHRRYRAGLRSCENAYDQCVANGGDWPEWGDSLLVPPQ